MLRFALAFGLLIFFADAVQSAEPPAFVVRTQPLAKLTAEWLALSKLAGLSDDGEDFLKNEFGEHGFRGFDLTRPLFGYAELKAGLEARLIWLMPVADQGTVLDWLDRRDWEATPIPGDKSLYRIGADDDLDVIFLRFAHGYAYFVLYGMAADLAPEKLREPKTLGDPGDAIVQATFRPAAIPASWEMDSAKAIDAVLDSWASLPILPSDLLQALVDGAKTLKPFLGARADCEQLTLGVKRPPKSTELEWETRMEPKPGSALAKSIAARKPVGHRFGSLVDWPDAAAVFNAQLPAWNKDALPVRAKLFEVIPSEIRDLLELSSSTATALNAFFSGIAKSDEAELGFVMTTPDKSGFGHVGLALRFGQSDDLLGSIKELLAKPPMEFGPSRDQLYKSFHWNAAQAEKTPIHTLDWKPFAEKDSEALFGETPQLAFAFDSGNLFVAFGPDAIGLVKRLIAVKPKSVGAVDLRINPKTLATWPVFGDDTTKTLGSADRLMPMANLTVDSGEALTIRTRFHIPLVALGRVWAERFDPIPPP